MSSYYEFKIKPLTGVHIGTGEVISPLDYTIKRLKSGNVTFIKFLQDEIIKSLDQEKLKDFNELIERGVEKEIRSFFHSNVSNISIDYVCDVTKDFYDFFNKKTDVLTNVQEVLTMYRPNGKNYPVIPGSSIKGAIRTAVINERIYKLEDNLKDSLERKLNNEKHKYRFVNQIYGAAGFQDKKGKYSANTDPFRSIKIQDIKLPVRETQVVGKMYSTKKGRIDEFTGIHISAEVIRGKYLGNDSFYEASIAIDTALNKTWQIKKPIELEEIIKSTDHFYYVNFDDEYKKFYEKNVNKEVELIHALKEEVENIDINNGEFLIRIGRWSQIENVTFMNSFRRPDCGEKGYGRTRTLFYNDEHYLPLGWCKCVIK